MTSQGGEDGEDGRDSEGWVHHTDSVQHTDSVESFKPIEYSQQSKPTAEPTSNEGSPAEESIGKWNVPRRFYQIYEELDGLHQSIVKTIGTLFISLFAIGLYNILVIFTPTIASFFIWLSQFIVENILVFVLSPIVAFQMWMYRKIRALENDDPDMETARPDGGQDLPPRDDKGRFKPGDKGTSGGGFIAGAVFGAAMGASYGGPQGMIAGAILGGFLGNELEKESDD